MFESGDKVTYSVTITGDQYLTLAALLKAASQDVKGRFAISRVFYDYDRDQFVATDGHALRVEKLDWLEDMPENSFFLSKRDLMLSKAQLMLKYGAEQNAKDIEDVLVPLEYMRYEDYPEHPYPNYGAVLPKDEARLPLEWIGMSLDLLAGLRSTFYVLPRGIRFQFHGALAGVALYDAMGGAEAAARFLGLVMPVRIMGQTPEPLFELKEIERKPPKGTEEAEAEKTEPSAEDLGQENLVEHAERGPADG